MNRQGLFWGAALIVAGACGGGEPDTDAGPAPDGGPPRCQADVDCNDGVFCNGVEECAPLSESADALGCIAGAPPGCPSGQMCSEADRACAVVCDVEPDADGDGHVATACGGDDCDDADAARYPGNSEVCDDGDHDEDCDPTTFGIRDVDLDGSPDMACCNEAADGTRTCGDDCNDTSRIQRPVAVEVCDGVDNDCDGTVDEGVHQARYADTDGDGFGDPSVAELADCVAAAGYSPFPTDCDDTDGDVYPGAIEACDGVDTNCDGLGEDDDADGHVSPGSLCTDVGGGLPRDDCDDDEPNVHGGRPEVCDGVDQDCDGVVDNRAVTDAACSSALSGAAGICAGGACHLTGCPIGRADCNGTGADGCEVDVETDTTSCGGCGIRCRPGATCADGLCSERPIVALAGEGSFGTCALFDDGTASCFGLSGRLLGAGLPDSMILPTAQTLVSGLGTIESIGTARDHACAVLSSGELWCWGLEIAGSFGTGLSEMEHSMPVQIPGISDATAYAGGFALGCVIRGAGDLYCTGNNGRGQVGIGHVDPVGAFSLVATDVRDVAPGFSNACYVRGADGQVYCWGVLPMDIGVYGIAQSPVAMTGLTGVEHLSSGDFFGCASRAGGEVWCWGDNTIGQIGVGTTVDTYVSPVEIGAFLGRDVLDLSSGWLHTCAVVADVGESEGEVWCWGRNSFGQIGDGLYEDRLAPHRVEGIDDAVQVVAGDQSTCVLRATNQVHCWGRNHSYRLGDGTTEPRPLPAPVLGFSQLGSVSVGLSHACLRLSTGGVRCWGGEDVGELGDGGTSRSSRPVEAIATGSRALALGAGFTCSLAPGGGVSCWGVGTAGQLGHGIPADSPTPVAAMLPAPAVAIASGGAFACALLDDASVACWGANEVGQLGLPAGGFNPTPARVPGLTDVREIGVGAGFACARRTDGSVWCWGHGASGQLGTDETILFRETPTPVHDLDSARSLAVGGYFACAGVVGDRVRCWGNNDFGELGDGTTMDRPVPSAPGSTIPGVAALAAGVEHACALTSEGALRCWGENLVGALGLGTSRPQYSTPQRLGLDQVRQVDAGAAGHSTCVATAAGRALCFGYNGNGQIGNGESGLDGDDAIVRSPVPVIGY